MNQLLPNRYVEIVHRLALGIEPLDAQRGGRLGYSLQAVYDAQQLALPRPPIERHASNLFSLRYQLGVTAGVTAGVATPLELRFFDAAERIYKPEFDRRRIVPRRLRIPVLTAADVEAAEKTDRQEFRRRIRRPAFFPGAAYDFSATTTGLRGRVMRGGKPMRWARVLARLSGSMPPGSGLIAGHAHGDDRGEFLLFINSNITTGSALPKPLNIEVSVFGPATPPVPNPATLPLLDPLWDLPVETLAAPGLDDPAASGTVLPAGYTAKSERIVSFVLGKCLCEEPEFVIT